MRVPAALIAIVLSIPLAAADKPQQVRIESPAPKLRALAGDPRCSSMRSYFADANGLYRGDKKLTPRKLTELPPATGYMAVYRHIGPCEAPLTVVEYRSGRR